MLKRHFKGEPDLNPMKLFGKTFEKKGNSYMYKSLEQLLEVLLKTKKKSILATWHFHV